MVLAAVELEIIQIKQVLAEQLIPVEEVVDLEMAMEAMVDPEL